MNISGSNLMLLILKTCYTIDFSNLSSIDLQIEKLSLLDHIKSLFTENVSTFSSTECCNRNLKNLTLYTTDPYNIERDRNDINRYISCCGVKEWTLMDIAGIKRLRNENFGQRDKRKRFTDSYIEKIHKKINRSLKKHFEFFERHERKLKSRVDETYSWINEAEMIDAYFVKYIIARTLLMRFYTSLLIQDAIYFFCPGKWKIKNEKQITVLLDVYQKSWTMISKFRLLCDHYIRFFESVKNSVFLSDLNSEYIESCRIKKECLEEKAMLDRIEWVVLWGARTYIHLSIRHE